MAATAMAIPVVRAHTHSVLIVTHTEIATPYHISDSSSKLHCSFADMP